MNDALHISSIHSTVNKIWSSSGKVSKIDVKFIVDAVSAKTPPDLYSGEGGGLVEDVDPLWKCFVMGYFMNDALHISSIHSTVNKIWSSPGKKCFVMGYFMNDALHISSFHSTVNKIWSSPGKRKLWHISEVPLVLNEWTPKSAKAPPDLYSGGVGGLVEDVDPLWKCFVVGYFMNDALHISSIHSTVNKIWSSPGKCFVMGYFMNDVLHISSIHSTVNKIWSSPGKRKLWHISEVPLVLNEWTPKSAKAPPDLYSGGVGGLVEDVDPLWKCFVMGYFMNDVLHISSIHSTVNKIWSSPGKRKLWHISEVPLVLNEWTPKSAKAPPDLYSGGVGGLVEDVDPLWKCFVMGYFMNDALHISSIHSTMNKIWSSPGKVSKIDDAVSAKAPPDLSAIPLWVDLKNVPGYLYSKKGLNFLSRTVGKFVKLHPTTERSLRLDVARVLKFPKAIPHQPDRLSQVKLMTLTKRLVGGNPLSEQPKDCSPGGTTHRLFQMPPQTKQSANRTKKTNNTPPQERRLWEQALQLRKFIARATEEVHRSRNRRSFDPAESGESD
ncbi:hypothetical protein Bca4012_006421 [Brassica carinata]